MTTCLINQSACGRTTGNPVCPKCGMDERVVYPGQGDREAAQEQAELRYWKTHSQAIEAELKAAQAREREETERRKSEEARRQAEHERRERERRIAQEAQAKREADNKAVGKVFRDAPWAPEMVVLPSGKYMMGSPESEPGRSSTEGPQHTVTIAYPLAMGKYPVTFEEWDACLADGGTSHKPDDEGWGRGKRPVINVSWHDAQQYAAWLNQKLGIATHDPTRYRLPSEAEWEYACRAGTTGMYSTPDGLMSDEWANYDASAVYTFEGAPKAGRQSDKTTPVGVYPANPWGLHDMHGNVWEWVQDGYEDSYRGAPTDGSARESGSSRRVLRGGSWCNIPRILRSASRSRVTPGIRNYDLGFRLARTAP